MIQNSFHLIFASQLFLLQDLDLDLILGREVRFFFELVQLSRIFRVDLLDLQEFLVLLHQSLNQLLLFGRGRALQPLLSVAPTLAIDLPLKALVWEDGSGKVWISYNTAEFLIDRHAAQEIDKVLKQITDRTASFVKKAIE